MPIGEYSSDFSTLLQESIPNRFMNLTPNQFEDFILTLFKDMGYTSQLTPRSNDYGGDVLAENQTEKIIIQVKRYHQNNTVGVQDINQVIGAKQYYNADKAIIVTTSNFSRNGVKLADQTDVELWDWDKLDLKIREQYLDGKTVYDYFSGIDQSQSKDIVKMDSLEFQVVKIVENCSMSDGSKCIIVHFKIRNLTDEIINVNVVSFPDIIDVFNNQFSATSYFTGYFTKGDIYPKASVECAYNFLAEQIPNKEAIKQIAIKYREKIPKSSPVDYMNDNEKTVILGMPKKVDTENLDPLAVKEKETKKPNLWWNGFKAALIFIGFIVFFAYLFVSWILSI